MEKQNPKKYRLVGADGKSYESATKGALGGHRKLKLYGRLDCRSAARFIANGQYTAERVFFADEATAIAAGYRPCAKCLPEKYREWKAKKEGARSERGLPFVKCNRENEDEKLLD